MNSVLPVTAIGSYAAEPSVKTNADGTVDFSSVLAEALEKELQEKSVSLTGGGDGASALQGGGGSGLMQMIMGAAASGETGDAQLALFMLCLMMQENEGSEFAPLLTAMASMLTNIKGDTGALRETVMRSDYHPYILSTIDAEVFKTGKAAALPVECWKPTTPALTGNPSNRSAQNLREIVSQFQVETATRYEPWRDGYTYCNIFVWDVTSALGAEIPHYVDPDTGAPRTYPDVKGAQGLNAPATQQWMLKHGSQYGWREVNAEEAQYYANMGRPAVTTHVKNGKGHVQVVVPSKDGTYDAARGVAIAQAGSRNYNYTNISSVYGQSDLKNVHYFVHE